MRGPPWRSRGGSPLYGPSLTERNTCARGGCRDGALIRQFLRSAPNEVVPRVFCSPSAKALRAFLLARNGYPGWRHWYGVHGRSVAHVVSHILTSARPRYSSFGVARLDWRLDGALHHRRHAAAHALPARRAASARTPPRQ